MKFVFNNLAYEVPEGVGISIEVKEEIEEIEGETHVHLDFNFVKDGEHIPMLGGTDEKGHPVDSWADLGIVSIALDAHPRPSEWSQVHLDKIESLVNHVLSGSWTPTGMGRWWHRERSQLDGKTPDQVFRGDPLSVLALAIEGMAQVAT